MVIKKNELKLVFLNISTIIALIIVISLQIVIYLQKNNLINLPSLVLNKLNIIQLIIITFFIISLLLRITINRVYNYFKEPEEKIFFSKIYSGILYSLGLFIILFNLGVSLSNITLLVGLIATGLAFAVRDVLLSFFAWTILLRKKPFRIGDYIKIGDDEGKVQHIGTFFVLLDSTPEYTEDFTRVPNKLFLEKSIINFGKNLTHEKIRFQLNRIPSKKDHLFNVLKNEIVKKIDDKNSVLINIDINNDKLYLIIEYLINFKDKRSKRSEIIEITYKILKNYIFFPEK